MKALKLFLLGCLSILSVHSFAQCNTNYQLIWSDEFDGTEVDPTKWRLVNGGGGFGNQEVQWYQPQNATVSNDLLHIKLAHETVVDGPTTYNYTSAKLETATLMDFRYGRLEASIKMPDALGSWPAFWMLGTDIGSVGWPRCGEIDIMEWVGRGPNVASGSIFFEGTWPANHLTTTYPIPQGQSFITDFHTFAIEWEPNEIRYYCDGNHYATYTPASIAPKDWLFNHDFFLMLNCAIGGTGGGPNISFTDPTYMEVDYVRVYSLPETAASITVEGPQSLMENRQNVLYTTDYFPNTTYTWTLPAGATIVDGDGTNSIHVNFGTTSGQVSVSAVNTCATLTDDLTVNLVADECTIMYDNFDDERKVSYESTGTLTELFANPSPDAFNASPFVGKYERSATETYDVLGVNDIALETALDYEARTKVFYMDLYTTAPVGTQITLQLENDALNGGAYPQGRRSAYVGYVAQQNGWHTVKFNYTVIISQATAPDQVDHIALLFDPGHLTSDVYYFDNFRREKDDANCPPLTTGILNTSSTTWINVYPNPVSDVLYVELMEGEYYSVYNHLGEKVMDDNSSSLNVAHLPNGIYFIKTGNKTTKFVKQ